MPAHVTFSAVIIDSAEPGTLAEFYRELTGLTVTYTDETYTFLGDSGARIGFQRVAGYAPPGWPDAAKHSHLDFAVDDLPGTVRRAVGLGAKQPAFQPGGDDWIVLTDPEGHPFCLTQAG
jgi:predicted enzyme related to lactoylglutathione lyase